MNKLRACAVLYLIVAIVTFGHAANSIYRNAAEEYERCDRATQICINESGFGGIFGGALAATFWPLYWSWEAWDD